MQEKDINDKIQLIVHDTLEDSVNKEEFQNDSILHVILSESSQALNFVCQIEDEFNIEFEDDEVDLEFFQSFDHIVKKIKFHLNLNKL